MNKKDEMEAIEFNKEDADSKNDEKIKDVKSFKWDGKAKEGLFEELLNSNLSEDEEEKMVKKFAAVGMSFRTIVSGPFKKYTEVISFEPRDPEDTWVQYKQYKEYMGREK